MLKLRTHLMSREWLLSISTRQTALKMEENRPIIPIPVHPMAYALELIHIYVPAGPQSHMMQNVFLSEDLNIVNTDKLNNTEWCTCS